MEDEAKIVYVQTHGTDEPSKAATPFYLATAAAAMDMEVSIYFTMHGPFAFFLSLSSMQPLKKKFARSMKMTIGQIHLRIWGK